MGKIVLSIVVNNIQVIHGGSPELIGDLPPFQQMQNLMFVATCNQKVLFIINER